ncbi:MAG: tetratricopeptide repeat protein [Actinomycetia bacterium]|nr:tetratricopeptide repeat protein [Actinomycetes bacterium]
MTIEYGTRPLPQVEEERLMAATQWVLELFQQGDPQEALRLAEQVWDQIPGDDLATKVLTAGLPQLVSGMATWKAAEAGLSVPALAWLERYWASYGNEELPTPMLHAGEVYYALGDREQAAQVFTRLLELHGTWPFREQNPDYLRLAKGEPVAAGPGDEPDDSALDRLAAEGHAALAEGEWELAVQLWSQALERVPPGASEATMWLCGSLANAYWAGGQFAQVVHFAQRALDASDRTNGFLWLRLGQAQLELGRTAAARAALTSALMLDGQDLFDEEAPEYLDFLRSEGVLDV